MDRIDDGERLRSVTGLLNTWSIPNDTRHPVDELPELFSDPKAWRERMPDIRFPRRPADRREITHLRDTLRASLSGHDAAAISDLVAAQQWRLGIDTDTFTVRWSVEPATAVGDALVAVVDAVVNRTWPRLRACPDCQWVFYDTSRNAQRTWCSMTAAGGGRGCGSIAKTRAYRRRQQANT